MADIEKVTSSVTTFFRGNSNTFLSYASKKCESPVYEPYWESKGELLDLLTSMKDFVQSKEIVGLQNLQIFKESGKTPALFFTVSPTDSSETYTILFYSHIDKIPFGEGWTKVDPYNPRIVDGYYYGRGVSTGLYSIFTILSLIKSMEELEIKKPKIAVLIESSFESGSPDLTKHLQNAIKICPNINQIICLETWGPSSNVLHYAKSTRGLISFDLKITTGKKAVHSGSFGGIIPDPMMIFNNLMSSRIETIEKSEDGKATNIKINDLEVEITEDQQEECKSLCDICGYELISIIPYQGFSQLIGSKNEDEDQDFLTAYINGVLRPSYNVLGFEQMPDIENASGALMPSLTARLCFRTPPSLDVNLGLENIRNKLTENPPFNAKIEILNEDLISGIDLDSTNSMSEEMINSFNEYVQTKTSKNAQPLRLARELPCLNYLCGMFKDVPILVTGPGDTFTCNTRNVNECLQLLKVVNFSACLTCFVSDYEKFKNN